MGLINDIAAWRNILGKQILRTYIENPASDFLRKTITSNEGTVTAGTTALPVVGVNTSRIALWVSNLSNQEVVVRFRAAAVDDLATGIEVPRGETIKVIGGGDVYTGEVSVVAFGASKIITFTEI